MKTTGRAPFMAASLLLCGPVWADNALLQAMRAGDAVRAQQLLSAHAPVNERDDTGATALMWAAQRSDSALTMQLLTAGADPNLRDAEGLGPLQIAIENHASEVALQLIEHGADARAARENGESVLMTAARIGDVPVMKALISHRADVNAHEAQFNQTALMWAAGHPEAVRLLLEHGAKVAARTKIWRVTQAVYTPRYRPLDANPWLHDKEYVTRKGGQTALFFAIQQDDADSVKALLDAGADVNDRSADGDTPLLLALSKWNPGTGRRCDMNDYPVSFAPDPAIANLLIDRGAAVNVRDAAGYTPLHGATLALVPLVELNQFCRIPAIHIDEVKDTSTASVAPDVGLKLVKRLLESKADPNAQVIYPVSGPIGQVHISFVSAGSSALHIAASSGNTDLMKLLLDHGGNAELIRDDGHSPLSLAVQADNLPLVELLAAHGADLARTYDPADPIVAAYRQDGTTDAKPRKGQSLLHIAAASGSSTVVPFLVSNGLSVEAKNAEGETPLMLAQSQERYRYERDRRDADLHRREGVPDIRAPESIALAEQTSRALKEITQRSTSVRTATNTLK